MSTLIKELYKHPKIIIPEMSIVNWAGFGNQPDGDALEILSNSASDVGLCTIWGTDKTTGLLCVETITLTGTDAVTTVKTNWDDIVAVFLGDRFGGNITRAVGTITIREASTNGAVTTITATNFQKGMFIIEARGLNVEVDNATGKIYWSTLTTVTALNGYYDAGTAVRRFKIGVSDYLYIISDNSGCTASVIVYED
jgi:hypothetical protein